MLFICSSLGTWSSLSSNLPEGEAEVTGTFTTLAVKAHLKVPGRCWQGGEQAQRHTFQICHTWAQIPGPSLPAVLCGHGKVSHPLCASVLSHVKWNLYILKLLLDSMGNLTPNVQTSMRITDGAQQQLATAARAWGVRWPSHLVLTNSASGLVRGPLSR